MTDLSLTGRCLCGAVTYTVPDAFRYAAICHCGDCRRATGSAFKPFAGIERDALRVVAGDDDLMVYGGDGDDGHDTSGDRRCRVCGSLLWSVVRDGAYVHVAMGTLVDPPSIRPSCHIFVGSMAPWDVIGDDLPQHEGHASA